MAQEPGGAIVLTNNIENWPGYKSITGLDLANKLEDHAKQYGTEVAYENATGVKKCDDCFTVTSVKKSYSAKSILFATGTRHKELDVPGEKEFMNKGIHVCALCDGAFYKGKTIAVAGGGDSAAKEALVLAEYAKQVNIIFRGDRLKAEPVNMKRIETRKNIRIMSNTDIMEITGDRVVKGIIIKGVDKKARKIELDAVFVDVGRIPRSELARQIGVKVNALGEILVDRDSRSNVPGVFAAGDVTDNSFKQAIVGAAEGVTAAYSAYKHINGTEFLCGCDQDR
jgi:thioredoxin reductase